MGFFLILDIAQNMIYNGYKRIVSVILWKHKMDNNSILI